LTATICKLPRAKASKYFLPDCPIRIQTLFSQRQHAYWGYHWAGNVEIHINSSDWHKHHHTHDKAYANVILHVVSRDDEPITLPDSRRLPTLELQNRISPELYDRYRHLIYGNQQIIPCQVSIPSR
jgi:hypothetical protein